MLFYKIDVQLQGEPETIERKEKAERANAMQSKIVMFCSKYEHIGHIGIASLHYEKAKGELCVAAKNGVLDEKLVEAFLVELDLPYKPEDLRPGESVQLRQRC